ncbi:multi antimicrobial extrusion protein MatE [Anaerobacillus alkalilacustris]|uniref:Multi antimicrobial extrusion protein MatE n=1 Tax=Anaerobacillus alkalilacustris TaxID=393763 RepID=A0A1S2LQ76_9BACI|nr:multi antimicrobial extrusion protein MatE [Anaerobacillus alkalilacustris]OIJ14662.1 multi antimicrobial extrusion protein MatE [Anaerobacillus alkalilacustris]
MSKVEELSISKILLFFIPLGLSASLVTISHIIINGTLTRGDNPEIIIASYVIAMSLFAITERLGVLLRHTCSALVRDKISYKAMSMVGLYVISSLMIVSLLIAYTPIGNLIFATFYGAKADVVDQIVDVYQVLVFVILFSAIRCLYQGVIILNRQTKWLTIGMIIRLIGMYLLSLYFIHTGNITAKSGAYIFLLGMFIESVVSFVEGRLLVKKMINKDENHKITTQRQVFRFYKPLIFSTLIIVLVSPIINAFLGKTTDVELAIASYAIALSITQLILSFFTYTHQIVLTFYKDHSEKVKSFTLIAGFVPTIILGIFCFTSIGPFFIETVLGANERLLEASMQSLRVFLLMTIVFPFLDFTNGLLLLRSQTKVMVLSQGTNVAVTLVVLFIAAAVVPEWNGMIGALAQSIGLIAELFVVGFFIVMYKKGAHRLTSKETEREKAV